MTHSKLQNPDILKINLQKIQSGIWLKTKLISLIILSANVALLMSTISFIDAKLGKWNKADLLFSKGHH